VKRAMIGGRVEEMWWEVPEPWKLGGISGV
jgi:hypothetical protein